MCSVEAKRNHVKLTISGYLWLVIYYINVCPRYIYDNAGVLGGTRIAAVMTSNVLHPLTLGEKINADTNASRAFSQW